jgi:hypothetical protein
MEMSEPIRSTRRSFSHSGRRSALLSRQKTLFGKMHLWLRICLQRRKRDRSSASRGNSRLCVGPYFEREAKRLKDEGLSDREIASRMNVCCDVAARLLRGKKNSFEYTEREIRSWRKKWLKNRSGFLHSRLFRNDRVWLAAQEKKSSRAGKGRRKNWSVLDKAYAPLLLSAAKSLKARFPSRRISYLALEEEIGVNSLKIKARNYLSVRPSCPRFSSPDRGGKDYLS